MTIKTLKPIFLAAALVLAAPAAHADIFEPFTSLLGGYGHDKENRALADAIEAHDLSGALNAIRRGADVNGTTSIAGVKFSQLDTAISEVATEGLSRRDGSEMVRLLIEHGAVPTVNNLGWALDAFPAQPDPSQGDFYQDIYKTADLLFDAVKNTFTKDDYTKLLFDMQHVNCKPDVMKRLLDLGADPNDIRFLGSVTESDGMRVTTKGMMPLDGCLEDMVLNPGQDNSAEEKGIDILLDHQADPSLVLNPPADLYMHNPASKTTGLDFPKVSDEAKALLKTILQKRQGGSAPSP